MSAEPEISVVICTRNRASQLAEVLGSAAVMRVPAGLAWELVIVDNGSTDGTAEVAQSFADRLPIRVVREDRAGLSNARNAGATAARGAYICWTDDDVVIDSEWLAAYAEAFRANPEADIVGGRVLPVMERPTPQWFAQLADEWPLANLLARRDFGDVDLPLAFDEGVIPWGANFAVRTSVQRRFLYEPGLGVSPNHKRVGEESEVIFHILRSGGAGVWTPRPTVQHIIPLKRQTWTYVYDYYFSVGETAAFLERTKPGDHHLTNYPNLRDVRSSRASLALREVAHRGIYQVARLLRAHRRAARSLARVGFYAGIAADRRR